MKEKEGKGKEEEKKGRGKEGKGRGGEGREGRGRGCTRTLSIRFIWQMCDFSCRQLH